MLTTIPYSDVVESMDVIGRGAYGAVIKASYKNMPVAVKTLIGLAGALNAHEMQNVKNEAAIQASLEHYYVARVFGLAVDEKLGKYGIVMELYDRNLGIIYLKECSLQRRVEYVVQAAAGLEYLHQRNVVHGDLKPTNILVTKGGEKVAITDFGFSAVRTGLSTSASKGVRGCGTDAFKAPELFEVD